MFLWVQVVSTESSEDLSWSESAVFGLLANLAASSAAAGSIVCIPVTSTYMSVNIPYRQAFTVGTNRVGIESAGGRVPAP